MGFGGLGLWFTVWNYVVVYSLKSCLRVVVYSLGVVIHSLGVVVYSLVVLVYSLERFCGLQSGKPPRRRCLLLHYLQPLKQ